MMSSAAGQGARGRRHGLSVSPVLVAFLPVNSLNIIIMGAVFSVLAAAATVRTIVAILRHAASRDYKGILSDVLAASGVGKFVGVASKPIKLAAKALDEGSMLHKGIVVVGRAAVPVASRLGQGVWGMLRSAVKL